jgi:diacylglycerol kinase (ATP)
LSRIVRKRFLIVHNRGAGQAARWRFDATVDCLRKAGAHLDILETAEHGAASCAAATAARSGEVDAIVAAGGDGTLHDAAAGLVGRGTPLGIIPLGTANVFAREIGLPFKPDHLAQVLLMGEVDSIRLGEVNGRPFLFVVGIGFDAEAVRIFERQGGRAWGQSGLIWPVVRALGSDRASPLHVTTPDGESEARWIIVTRAKRYAGNLMLAPNADLHDRQLQLLTMRGGARLDRMLQLATLAAGMIRFGPGVELRQVDWVRVAGDALGTPIQIDGELHGGLPLAIGLHPKQLRVIRPAT